MEQSIRVELDKIDIDTSQFEGLVGHMASSLVTSKSENTSRKYFCYFKKWENYILEKGGIPIPASPILVAMYITDLMRKMSTYSVIVSTVYSIKWAHCLKGVDDPTDNSYVKNLLDSANAHYLSQ